MKKTFKLYCAIWAVLLVVFNVIAFVSVGWEGQEKYTASFWIGYVFITLCFVGQVICAKVAFNAKNLQKMFYNLPLITITYAGLIASFVVGGLCMLLSPLPYWVGVIACVVVLAAVAIPVLKACIAVDAVAAVDEKVKAQTFFIKSLTVDAQSLVARAEGQELKALCQEVYETVRYSDPMSSDALAAAESQITLRFAELSRAVNDNSLEAAQKAAKEVVILLGDRNNKCKLLK